MYEEKSDGIVGVRKDGTRRQRELDGVRRPTDWLEDDFEKTRCFWRCTG